MGYKAYSTSRKGAHFHVGLYDGKSGALTALGLLAGVVPAAGATPVGPPQVPVVAVGTQAADGVMVIDGSLQAVRQSVLSAQASGRIASLSVKAGDRVRAGQVLVVLDDRTAQAGVAQAQAGVAQAQANLAQAKAAYERAKELRSQGFIAQAALDSAQATFRAAEAGVAAARAGQTQAGVAQGFTRLTAPYDGRVLATHAETGQLATRRTTEAPEWHPLDGVRLDLQDDICHASGGHVEGRVPLADLIELKPDGRFLLVGRHADMVNIAGKRNSIAHLNHQLNAIPQVQDGAFFLPEEEADGGVARLAAAVVAPGLDRQALLDALRQRIDPVFLPRPLIFVERLPRNANGKLTRDSLAALLRSHRQAGADPAP